MVSFLLRLVLTCLGGYLAVVLVVATVAEVPHWAQRGLAGLVCRTAGLTLATAVAAPGLATMPPTVAIAAEAPVLEPVEQPPVPVAEPPARPLPGPSSVPTTTHTVTTGESFWTIAAA